MFRLIMLIAMMTASVSAFGQDFEMRAHVATRMAKAIIQSDQVLPDENNKEICDGSGFITHGDGHRTPCPGCKACKKPDGEAPAKAVVKQSDIMVYHMGADWCPPCNRMKKETWGNLELSQWMQKEGVKLYYMDYDNPKQKKFFNFYRVSSFPTVLVLNRKQLDKPLSRLSGFVSADTVKKTLKEKVDE